jgi:hypothetical protein
MKLKKIYKHDNKKQIWRILPTANKKLVIEERDPKTKEVFFSCYEIESGNKLFKDFQLDEKNWIGIENIYKDIIFFHNYTKPDMPVHKSIIAFDVLSKTILWQNNNYVFSFVNDDKVYCYQQRFESKVFFSLDYLNGSILEDFGNDYKVINQLKEQAENQFTDQSYLFPEYYKRTNLGEEDYDIYLQQILSENIIKGEVSYLKKENLLLFNYHEISKTNLLDNVFIAVDLLKNKIILKETLDKNLSSLMPDSFFVKDDFLFLIVDKTKLLVYGFKY